MQRCICPQSISTYAKVGHQVELPARIVETGKGEWGSNLIPDYEVVANAYRGVGETTGAGNLVLNFRMEPLTEEGRKLAKKVFGDSCVTPEAGESFRLCTDPKDSDRCPTRMGDDRPHDCAGILARHSGSELFWIACTEIDGLSPEFALGPGKPQLPDGLYARLQSGDPPLSDQQIEALWAHMDGRETTVEQKGLLAGLNVEGY